MTSLPEFRIDRSAAEAHGALRRSLEIADRAQHCAVLWFGEILRRKLYRELGYSSMNQYAELALGFSRSKTGDFLRLAARLEELPVLKESVAAGRVPYTKAREVIRVATPRTEARWVGEAETSSRRELAAKVARVRKKAATRRAHPGQGELLPVDRDEAELVREAPVNVALVMSPEQFARWEALWEKLKRLGGAKGADEMLEALAGRVAELERGTSGCASDCDGGRCARSATRVAPATMIHIHECPTCAAATVQTSAGEKRLGAATLERARCDAVVVQPGHRARNAIPPTVRRAVLERDRHRCQSPGCSHTRFLEIHHKRPVARGGGNEMENLVTLCSGCHGLVHAGKRAGATMRARTP